MSDALLHTERLVALSGFPGLGDLKPTVVSSLAEHVKERFYKAGAVIFQEDQPVTGPLLINSGSLKLSRRDLLLGSFGARSAVGFSAALAKEPKPLYGVAETDVYAYEIERDVLLELFEEHFDIYWAVLRNIARRLMALRQEQGGDGAFEDTYVDFNVPDHDLDLVERIFLLRQIMIIAGSRIEALGELAREAQVIRCEPGHILWNQGDQPGDILMIVKGQMVCTTAAGQKFAFHAGDVAGGLDSMGQIPRWFTAEVSRSFVALRIGIDAFSDVLEDNTDIGIHMLQSMTEGLELLREKRALRLKG